MKQVYLIGDSIRHGYKETVRKELEGVAEVAWPEANCGTTSAILVGLSGWVLNRKVDLVHANGGLHDIKTVWFGGRTNVVPLAHYRDNVETILRTIREQAGAKVIWATTTPVNYKKAHDIHAKHRDFDRYEEDVVAYNKAAVEVCNRLGVPVNDLYSVIMSYGKDKCLDADGVHFTPEASELLGKTVAATIRKWL
jgi:lysophospholipase L1-like esterase